VRRFRFITGRHRSPSTNRALGMLLAFTAGAVNAGGFLVLHLYTSHMTGFASQLADGTVLGNMSIVANALGAICAFVAGAAVCAILVNWARRHHLHSVYALPLALEACLLAIFGLLGAMMQAWQAVLAVPLTVLLLAFTMGLQNAVASKTSGGSIRTTHMTGNITDLGMELGKMAYWNGASTEADAATAVRHSPLRFLTALGLIGMFVLGALLGAYGFKHIGFVCVVPLAAALLALSIPPLWRDIARRPR